jgi:hypothetical protein
LQSTNLSEEQLLRDEQIAVLQQILAQQVQDNSNMQNVVISLQQEKEDRTSESESVSTMMRELAGRIVAVDGTSMAPLRVEDVAALIRGSPNTPVMLTIAPASLEAGGIDGQDNGNRDDGGSAALPREDISQVSTLWRCERGCGYKSLMFADVGVHEKICQYQESVVKDHSGSKEFEGGPLSTTDRLSRSGPLAKNLAREWRVSEVSHKVKGQFVDEEVDKQSEINVAIAVDQYKTLSRELARFLFCMCTPMYECCPRLHKYIVDISIM